MDEPGENERDGLLKKSSSHGQEEETETSCRIGAAEVAAQEAGQADRMRPGSGDGSRGEEGDEWCEVGESEQGRGSEGWESRSKKLRAVTVVACSEGASV